MDSLSLILDDMHFDGVVFASTHNSTPWAWHLATPGLAAFHMVTNGQAWLIREGEEPLLLQTGDLIVLPAGCMHRIQDKPQTMAVAQDLVPFMAKSELEPQRHGGQGEPKCDLISGHARFDVDMAAPLIAALPSTLHVRGLGEAPPVWLAIGLQFLAHEVSSPRPAQQAIINRLGDILFMECIRDYVEAVPEGSGNWLAALKDRALSNALANMHRDPRRNWTVPELAQQACLSRSAFADRFSQTLGEPPLTYLTRHRMRLAARQLANSGLSISKIADQVGYASEAAFSQAFKREYGASPSAWRQQRLSALDTHGTPRGQTDTDPPNEKAAA
ncbi:MAG: AraC family transcriptional regulator [Aquabacterium sp.]|uniref:AraC family transcriptional regulator n=1 Tax=Aquabacterium sp. TaxID=1872578 RepID=UPI001224B0CD|nr:AraC family transcriptional regulator [Aquabacterium sp.]TAK99964.1 MAG: AraC family transcriptional regulator [Aquabacterium sp.]